MDEKEIECKICGYKFTVAAAVLESRVIDTCVKCFRTAPTLVPLTTKPMVFRPDFIDMNIFLGGYRCAMDFNVLQELNIGRVLVCGNDIKQYFPECIQYFQLPLEDDYDEEILPWFERSHEFIRTSRKNVLVHCHAGVSRSATIVISYLMKTNGLSADKAKAFVKNKRKCVNPNPGFMLQLVEYEHELKREMGGTPSPTKPAAIGAEDKDTVYI